MRGGVRANVNTVENILGLGKKNHIEDNIAETALTEGTGEAMTDIVEIGEIVVIEVAIEAAIEVVTEVAAEIGTIEMVEDVRKLKKILISIKEGKYRELEKKTLQKLKSCKTNSRKE